jgi:hypothetical protein
VPAQPSGPVRSASAGRARCIIVHTGRSAKGRTEHMAACGYLLPVQPRCPTFGRRNHGRETEARLRGLHRQMLDCRKLTSLDHDELDRRSSTAMSQSCTRSSRAPALFHVKHRPRLPRRRVDVLAVHGVQHGREPLDRCTTRTLGPPDSAVRRRERPSDSWNLGRQQQRRWGDANGRRLAPQGRRSFDDAASNGSRVGTVDPSRRT